MISSSRSNRHLLLAGVVVLAIAAAAGCSTLGYYAQSIDGHFAMLRAARPIPDIVADPGTAETLKQRLQRAQEIRAFASQALGLPENASYRSYADLQRPYVVWNVFAAPELSLELKQWCYPVVGCAGYRGYFDRDSADRAATELRAEGYEVNVAGVPAYSTLGWFSDPLLNTFIGGTEGQLAGLVFHELAHQVVFVGGDTTFNESFATAVEREGVRRWLGTYGNDASRKAYAQFAQRRSEFLDLLLRYRALLLENYQSQQADDLKRARKQHLFARLREDYARLKASWDGFAGYDRFFAQDLTNAHLASIGAYNDLVPAFDALLAQVGGELPRFYEEVKRLAALPKERRDDSLRGMLAQR
ncbi:MAG TPA: aminopeptidase [Burkholderiaceae bacterium]|nr:aminopeptidase [Burkholderiaceae bacterium]